MTKTISLPAAPRIPAASLSSLTGVPLIEKMTSSFSPPSGGSTVELFGNSGFVVAIPAGFEIGEDAEKRLLDLVKIDVREFLGVAKDSLFSFPLDIPTTDEMKIKARFNDCGPGVRSHHRPR